MWSIQPGAAAIRRDLPSGTTLAYTNKVKALSPIAYWPMADQSGAVALDESGNGRNGAYTGVTLGNTGIGDGRTAAGYDGATSYGNIYSASLAGAFSGPEGTLVVWARVSGVGVWTDATSRIIARLAVNGSNEVLIQKNSVSNQWLARYVAAGTSKSAAFASGSSLAWNHLAITWSASADQGKLYLNGVQQGATLTGLGVWSGAIASTTTLLGAFTQTPSFVFSGNLAHAALWTTPLSAAQILSLATVP